MYTTFSMSGMWINLMFSGGIDVVLEYSSIPAILVRIWKEQCSAIISARWLSELVGVTQLDACWSRGYITCLQYFLVFPKGGQPIPTNTEEYKDHNQIDEEVVIRRCCLSGFIRHLVAMSLTATWHLDSESDRSIRGSRKSLDDDNIAMLQGKLNSKLDLSAVHSWQLITPPIGAQVDGGLPNFLMLIKSVTCKGYSYANTACNRAQFKYFQPQLNLPHSHLPSPAPFFSVTTVNNHQHPASIVQMPSTMQRQRTCHIVQMVTTQIIVTVPLKQDKCRQTRTTNDGECPGHIAIGNDLQQRTTSRGHVVDGNVTTSNGPTTMHDERRTTSRHTPPFYLVRASVLARCQNAIYSFVYVLKLK
ncbi:uncharacterized protein LACBIDRAFT_333986 [Laccaria bicolor S238N-H82]|uniref:Predicted protein n=1 Tax=Laccaria bicolor (strain S238N-H82 / ATCC MYA-4686) TaxID=486041 RepID=B0DXQ8_LACBS|nr:uncharacterized protein LACBIDRAFT_333986 [Laccaria bicolor S238N-H82]EDR00724.1 predicted protein [Laccaria bicolor S238N-H82]|eukprot:XP_001888733.1 predicted protein [Laccaria bicolor S238N-H82]